MGDYELEHAFRYVRCVIVIVGIHNLRSQRAVEKIGGERVGTSSDAPLPARDDLAS